MKGSGVRQNIEDFYATLKRGKGVRGGKRSGFWEVLLCQIEYNIMLLYITLDYE